jgi:hypothetical protein
LIIRQKINFLRIHNPINYFLHIPLHQKLQFDAGHHFCLLNVKPKLKLGITLRFLGEYRAGRGLGRALSQETGLAPTKPSQSRKPELGSFSQNDLQQTGSEASLRDARWSLVLVWAMRS